MNKKITIPVVGMACSSCSAHVEKKLNSLEGVKMASVSLSSRSALVEYEPSVISLQQMKEAVNDIGFDLVIEQDRSVVEIERREYALLLRKTILAWIFAISVMALCHFSNDDGQLSLILSLACLWTCGRQFYVNAWKQLRHGMARFFFLFVIVFRFQSSLPKPCGFLHSLHHQDNAL